MSGLITCIHEWLIPFPIAEWVIWVLWVILHITHATGHVSREWVISLMTHYIHSRITHSSICDRKNGMINLRSEKFRMSDSWMSDSWSHFWSQMIAFPIADWVKPIRIWEIWPISHWDIGHIYWDMGNMTHIPLHPIPISHSYFSYPIGIWEIYPIGI